MFAIRSVHQQQFVHQKYFPNIKPNKKIPILNSSAVEIMLKHNEYTYIHIHMHILERMYLSINKSKASITDICAGSHMFSTHFIAKSNKNNMTMYNNIYCYD